MMQFYPQCYEAVDRAGNTLLHLAAEKNNCATLTVILENLKIGRGLRSVCIKRQTVERTEVEDERQSKSDEENYDDMNGYQSEVIKLIFTRNGADDTALDIALRHGFSHFLLIIQQQLMSSSSTHIIIDDDVGDDRGSGGCQTVEALQDSPVFPLHKAARFDHPGSLYAYVTANFMRRMKSNNVALDELDDNGCTALMYCAERGDIQGVQTLLQYGANLTKENKKGKNVLHHLIIKYKERPLMRQDIQKVFDVIQEEPNFDKLLSRAYYVHDVAGLKIRARVTPMPLAAALGAVDIVESLLGCYHADETNKTIYYNLKYFVPGSLHTKQKTPAEADSNNDIDLPPEPGASCCELMVKHCDDDRTERILRIQPVTAFLLKLSHVRTAVYWAAFVVHVIFMSCFTSYVLQISHVDVISRRTSVVTNKNNAYWAFLTWPIIILMFELICVYKLVNLWIRTLLQRCHTVNNVPSQHASAPEQPPQTLMEHISNLFKFIIQEYFTKGDLPMSTYIKYFGILSHISCLSFCGINFYWIHMYKTLDDNNLDSYIEITTVALVYGWMHTIEYVKGFTKTHSFVLMLKVIFIKDILRLMFIYGFVMMGFGFAGYLYVLVDQPSWSELNVVAENATLVNIIYQTFGIMFGGSDMLKIATQADTEFKHSNPSVIRLLFATYVCISIIVLMSILIAMMNNTYQAINAIKDALWCFECLHFLVWISNDNVIGMRTLTRIFLERFVTSRQQNTERRKLTRRPKDLQKSLLLPQVYATDRQIGRSVPKRFNIS